MRVRRRPVGKVRIQGRFLPSRNDDFTVPILAASICFLSCCSGLSSLNFLNFSSLLSSVGYFLRSTSGCSLTASTSPIFFQAATVLCRSNPLRPGFFVGVRSMVFHLRQTTAIKQSACPKDRVAIPAYNTRICGVGKRGRRMRNSLFGLSRFFLFPELALSRVVERDSLIKVRLCKLRPQLGREEQLGIHRLPGHHSREPVRVPGAD